MNETEYHAELQSIFNLCALVRHLKVAAVLAQIERAELLGPVLQPTAYRKAITSLEWQKKCTQAALRFQRAVNEIASNPTYLHPGGKQP